MAIEPIGVTIGPPAAPLAVPLVGTISMVGTVGKPRDA
jgi:hypothetical protein